jgi:PTS system beta-glucosides-specific IIC component
MGFFQKFLGKTKTELCAPVSGEVIPLNQVSDPTFGTEMVGKGVAIRPAAGAIVAPCTGKVDMVFETGHAITLIADCGAEILIHVGLDTVNLKGEHFSVKAKPGEKVTVGDLLLEFDREAIAEAGYDTVTPMVVCNPEHFGTFETYTGKVVIAGDPVIGLASR